MAKTKFRKIHSQNFFIYRQFFRTTEKEAEKERKEQKAKMREVIIYGEKLYEQRITYKKRPYSQVVYRGKDGRFIKNPAKKLPQAMPQKKVEKEIFGTSPFYRAGVMLEVWYHEKYYYFGIIVIDYKENIDINAMMEETLTLIEKALHYKRTEFWFPCDKRDNSFSVMHPRRYNANRPSKMIERWNRTKFLDDL